MSCFRFLGTVDEHFAKALGQQTWKQIQVQNEAAKDDESVDDHFTKALGDTWLRIKAGRDPVNSPDIAQQQQAALR